MKTLEKLIEENIDIDYPHTLDRYTVLDLLKRVREATIKECVNKVKIEKETYEFGFIGSEPINYIINKTELLNLDLNSIEL